MRTKLLISTFIVLLLPFTAFTHPNEGITSDSETYSPVVTSERSLVYAVLVKQSTYDDPNWQAVVDALLTRYSGQLFIWETSPYNVQSDVAVYRPTHIGFVCEYATATSSFVQGAVWSFIRSLDDDPYCDAIWGIITGYDVEDALNLVTGPTGFEVKTVLGGTSSCDLKYYTQGIGTNEATYRRYYVKRPDSIVTTTYDDGPVDRTEWLVTMLNEGIDIFDYDQVDIFYTSGHGAHNMWQMHYPSAGLEGYFRSSDGQVYGDPYSGANINIESDHPRIYFGLGNCNIGQILHGGSMVPSWIHTGGAFQYTGYVISEGSNSHQHGGTKAYFYKAARNYTWAEAFFLANQALRFDMINGTPGANPPDLNGSALYGDPAMQVKMSCDGVFEEPLFASELTVNAEAELDTVTFKITMNREGSPGYTSKWGERHPAVILPFRAENPEIVYTDAITAVVEDDFALMYVWYQGQPSLAEGETREVVFTCQHTVTGVEEGTGPLTPPVVLAQNHPNPFNPSTLISYDLRTPGHVSLQIYNLKGQLMETLVDESQQAGDHSVIWDASAVSSGAYFYRITVAGSVVTRKCLVLK